MTVTVLIDDPKIPAMHCEIYVPLYMLHHTSWLCSSTWLSPSSRVPKITAGELCAHGPEFATPAASDVSTAGTGLPQTHGITVLVFFFLRKAGSDVQLRLGRRRESEIGC